MRKVVADYSDKMNAPLLRCILIIVPFIDLHMLIILMASVAYVESLTQRSCVTEKS